MTVQELIELLQKFDPNKIVISQRDAAGNSYSPMAGAWAGAYDHTSQKCGYTAITDDLASRGFTDEDIVAGDPAVVLWAW